MTTQLAAPPTIDELLAGMRLKSHTDIAFLARRIADGDAVQVTNIVGAETGTMTGLVVRRGAGLGGKALALLRPVSVTSYRAAAGITHEYDAQVLGERIEMLSAFPVSLGGAAPYVVYLGRRTPTRIGDRWYEQITPLVREFSTALVAPQPLRSDAKTQQKSPLSRAQLDAALIELEELTALAGNSIMRSRLERLRTTLTTPEAPAVELETPLTARETEVLREVANGLSNRQAGAALGLTENTVKSYLKSAMGKLKATNRVQAISTARDFGLID